METAVNGWKWMEMDGGTDMKSNKGWQCPVCKVVYAPSVGRCECAQEGAVTSWEVKWPYEPTTTIDMPERLITSGLVVVVGDGKYRMLSGEELQVSDNMWRSELAGGSLIYSTTP
jgi:hypothetical protein